MLSLFSRKYSGRGVFYTRINKVKLIEKFMHHDRRQCCSVFESAMRGTSAKRRHCQAAIVTCAEGAAVCVCVYAVPVEPST